MTQDQIEKPMSQNARRGAAIVAIVAAVTLATRLFLRLDQSDGVLDALSYMSQYFTLLTNTLVLLMMLWIALGQGLSSRIAKTIMIATDGVGLVYHAPLAHLVNLSGFDLGANHGTHTFVPILTALWWIFLAPKPALRRTDFPMWVTWPIVYCVYILIRASFSGFYPYPFLNVPVIGWGGLFGAVAGLVIGFIAIGLILTVLGRLAPSQDR